MRAKAICGQCYKKTPKVTPCRKTAYCHLPQVSEFQMNEHQRSLWK